MERIKGQYLQLVMTVLIVTVHGAPPVFLLQPLVLTNEGQFGNLQSGTGLVLTLDGHHVFFVASGSPLESQGQEGAEEQYDETYNESQVRNEQYESEERQKEMEENDDKSQYNAMTENYEGNEDRGFQTHEDITTDIPGLQESSECVQEGEEVSENPQEDGNVSESGSSEKEDRNEDSSNEPYDEKTESQADQKVHKEN